MGIRNWFGVTARGSRQPWRPTLDALEERVVPTADSLYVADFQHGGVLRFDADTGANLGTFVEASKSLKGGRGVLIDGQGHLLLANQNAGRGKPGEIMRYSVATGAFDGEVVPFQDPNAPFAPRGMVLKDNVLYVASLQDADEDKAGIAPDGRVAMFNATTGAFLGVLTPPDLPGQYNPRGIVFGPDGKLYVSVFDSSNLAAGHIIRFDLANNTATIFATNDGDGIAEVGETADLHRPEGLVFGPDSQLYVTSFRKDANDVDRILILNGATGVQVDSIDLDAVGQPRAFGQALLFGPGGDLFIPVSGNGPDTGAVRRYDVSAKTYTNLVAPGTMVQPWYLSFGNTDPATLAYVAALSASKQGSNAHVATLTRAELEPLLVEALTRWQEAGWDISGLAGVHVHISNLPGARLGQTDGSTIWIDGNAASWGWFVDATPGTDTEFTTRGNQGERSRIDLLSVLLHETGHLLGLDHDASGVMSETLRAGSRWSSLPTQRLPITDEVLMALLSPRR